MKTMRKDRVHREDRRGKRRRTIERRAARDAKVSVVADMLVAAVRSIGGHHA